VKSEKCSQANELGYVVESEQRSLIIDHCSLIIDIGMKVLHPAVEAICKSPLSVLAVSSEQRKLNRKNR